MIRPSHVKFFGNRTKKTLYPPNNPFSVIAANRSALLHSHVEGVPKSDSRWSRDQLKEIVSQHESSRGEIDERDLLRTSGALSKLGINLGMYRRSGIDCPDARFSLSGYPDYPCPIEVEAKSSGFLASHHRQHRKQRVVLLCMFHDAAHTQRGYVDVLEVRELARILDQVA